jgi:hypothetical protein
VAPATVSAFTIAEDLRSAVDFAIVECRAAPSALTRSGNVHERVWGAFLQLDEWRRTHLGDDAAGLLAAGVAVAANTVSTSMELLTTGTRSAPVSRALWLTEVAMKLATYLDGITGVEDVGAVQGACCHCPCCMCCQHGLVLQTPHTSQ